MNTPDKMNNLSSVSMANRDIKPSSSIEHKPLASCNAKSECMNDKYR